MTPSPFISSLSLSLTLSLSLLSSSSSSLKVNALSHPSLILPRASPPPEGFFNPNASGGSLLAIAPKTGGLGEPMNVIISGASDPDILNLGDGWINWVNSIGFSRECLGQHIGDAFSANLGDGNGMINQTEEMRWDYGDPQLGTCKETADGGNHFRYWIQNGSKFNSGAIFMASSIELPLAQFHDPTPNGYDDGRDQIVGNATSDSNGTWTPTGWSFTSTNQMISGLLPNGSEGINHDLVIDGKVAVLTVKVTNKPSGNGSGSGSGSGAERLGLRMSVGGGGGVWGLGAMVLLGFGVFVGV